MRRYAEWVIKYRFIVIVLALLVTGGLAFQIKNLRVVIDPNTNLPQTHSYVQTTNRVEKLFGSKNVVIIGITPKTGDIYRPEVLAKVQRITAALMETSDVLRDNMLSLTARRAKNIIGTPEGMEIRPLMENLPESPAESEALRRAVYANPVYFNAIVSKDDKTASIIAEYKDPKTGYQGIIGEVQAIVDKERDDSVEISMGGWPVFGAQLEQFSQRMAFLFPIAVLITGLIHYEAFRTIQGLVLPLVTALLAVIWGVGVMGASGIPMDAFNASTPILILAVAAGHAVQILKRYYEEYHRFRTKAKLTPHEANEAAVVESVSRIGAVMLTAGLVAALGFFSLFVFKLTVIRTFGIFTGIGILSALILEMTFIPALRSLLPPPKEREQRREQEERIWDKITGAIADAVVGPGRKWIFAGFALLVVVWTIGAFRVTVDNSNKSYFFKSLPFQEEDRRLNERLGGTNTLYLLVEGKKEDSLKDPKVLRAIEATQRFVEGQPHVGKTVSIADFVKKMNQAMHGDDPAFYTIPESGDLISQYLLLYSMSGEPGDFDSYVDYGYRSANIWVFLKSDSSARLQALLGKLETFLPKTFGDEVQVKIGGGAPVAAAMNEVMVQGKILNIFQIGGVIFLITSIVFRSFVAGLFVLVPLSLAVLGNFGLMGLTGIRLNIATSVISAMAVGIGADYAIYLIYRFREELGRGLNEEIAIRTALATAGKAVLFVSSAIAGGYGVLLLSWGFYIHIWFGLLTSVAMLVSSLSALIFLPSLILTFRPRFIFGGEGRGALHAPEIASVLLLTASLAGIFSPAAGWSADFTAERIMEKNFVASKVTDSVSDATFTLINKDGQERVRKTFGTTKLQPNGIDNMRMVRFTSPPDIKGTVTLLVEHSDKDDDIWVYLPALKKVRRLVSSNKKDSFVGTDFSYGDVIGYKVAEWEHRLLPDETIDGHACYVIESTPKSDTVKGNSGYSKRKTWIAKESFVALQGEIWDLSGQPLKTFAAADVKAVDPARGRWQPMRLEAKNTQTGHKTVIRFEGFKANQGVKDEFFTTRYMESER